MKRVCLIVRCTLFICVSLRTLSRRHSGLLFASALADDDDDDFGWDDDDDDSDGW